MLVVAGEGLEGLEEHGQGEDVQQAEAIDGVDSPVNTEVELTEDQAANFTYGQEMVDSLILPDWSLIMEKKADWINRWNELFSVQ